LTKIYKDQNDYNTDAKDKVDTAVTEITDYDNSNSITKRSDSKKDLTATEKEKEGYTDKKETNKHTKQPNITDYDCTQEQEEVNYNKTTVQDNEEQKESVQQRNIQAINNKEIRIGDKSYLYREEQTEAGLQNNIQANTIKETSTGGKKLVDTEEQEETDGQEEKHKSINKETRTGKYASQSSKEQINTDIQRKYQDRINKDNKAVEEKDLTSSENQGTEQKTKIKQESTNKGIINLITTQNKNVQLEMETNNNQAKEQIANMMEDESPPNRNHNPELTYSNNQEDKEFYISDEDKQELGKQMERMSKNTTERNKNKNKEDGRAMDKTTSDFENELIEEEDNEQLQEKCQDDGSIASKRQSGTQIYIQRTKKARTT
jgi:hypothetical protein